MTILKIARMGHPVLLRRADEVAHPGASELQKLIDDMTETLADAGGVGLAAPQVHVSQRLFLYSVPEVRSEGEEDPPLAVQVIINPALEPVDDEMIPRFEGCLSIPGMRGEVPRYKRVRYTGYDRNGQPVAGVASGFRAHVMQHEMDHLDGILYPMRMTDMGRFGYEAEMVKYGVRT
ncbi:peptide deformylase [Acetobacter thailandicus]|uniref:Peptide deformylase n=1 Tax=Acetobacter thailandicus TaxID=1502842 RepID=A0ABT3QAZ1_9PROT|nr:peptide deformylase [Acetobacter thailandicus]MCX2562451.1 peptide deformylase [Acetobacter thailandicus]NHN94517.1 peptide deformylase [Acetobacter thailandicus]